MTPPVHKTPFPFLLFFFAPSKLQKWLPLPRVYCLILVRLLD
jgi:hypothetical protein